MSSSSYLINNSTPATQSCCAATTTSQLSFTAKSQSIPNRELIIIVLYSSIYDSRSVLVPLTRKYKYLLDTYTSFLSWWQRYSFLRGGSSRFSGQTLCLVMAPPEDQPPARELGSMRSAKQPMPRQLGLNENMRTLRHWRSTVRNYYRLDDINSHFLNEDLAWNSAVEHYSLAAETTGLKRTPAILKQDLVAFLETISGYLPHAYITDNLVKGTKSIMDVWKVIEDLYGAEVNAMSFLQLNSFKREPEETHKQFYERLVDHCRTHLVRDETKIEGRATSSDQLTILALNLITIVWLNKMHPKLIDIVQVEYAPRLRGRC